MQIKNLEIAFAVTLSLTESEARALEYMLQFEESVILEVYQKHLGNLGQFENGFRDLVESVKIQLTPRIRAITEIQKNIMKSPEKFL